MQKRKQGEPLLKNLNAESDCERARASNEFKQPLSAEILPETHSNGLFERNTPPNYIKNKAEKKKIRSAPLRKNLNAEPNCERLQARNESKHPLSRGTPPETH